MKLSERLASLPPPLAVAGARALLARELTASRRKLVVVDDDPTGTQTVHGVRVYMDWSVKTLTAALRDSPQLFYLSTNSRSLSRAEAEALARGLGRNLKEASAQAGVELVLASRSDSTLRGHFPHEVTALADGVGAAIDGILIVPAFFEAGRYTIDDIHWVAGGAAGSAPDELVPAAETEFARDPDFGFYHSNLKEWVEEKSGGRWPAAEVATIPLAALRSAGVDSVAAALASARGGAPVIANAACYEDLEVLALGVARAEQAGKRFVYRTAASFVMVRGGIEERPLLSAWEMGVSVGAGLILAGSYVAKTTRQIELLLRSKRVEGIELSVEALLEEQTREGEVARAAGEATRLIRGGITTLVFTSRKVDRREDFLSAGRTIMSGLCAVVSRIEAAPSYLVAKGGITSIELARTALGVTAAEVLGQAVKGVPVWRLGAEARWPALPYVVFPGNVGEEDALVRVVEIMQGTGVSWER